MSVILRKRENIDGTTSLRLYIWHNGRYTVETLKHLQLAKPSNTQDREANKDKLNQAKKIVIARAAELEANNYNITSDLGKKTIVLDWMQAYVNGYKKKDIRAVAGALNRFRDFLTIEENKPRLTFNQINALLIEDFIEYLESKSKGEGAASYYARFKKMIRQAYRKKYMKENVLDYVERSPSGKAAKKDFLTTDEIKELVKTPTESDQVRRAAIFCLMTGLRWVDVSGLKWKNINLKEKVLNLAQSKTGEALQNPLNDAAIKILPEPGAPAELVFNLPTANGANKTLKAWVKRAGITKKITWHNLRHSAGTNMALNEVDLLTISKVLGHNTVKYTQRYVNTANELKQAATNKLNIEL